MTHLENIVIGGGIVGLATAYALVKRGHSVALFESNGGAFNASIRNFGLIWPSGQKLGPMRQIALHSRSIWVQAARELGFPIRENGSLYLAETDLACQIATWYAENDFSDRYSSKIVSPKEASLMSSAIIPDRIQQALYCPADACVHPVVACRKLEDYMNTSQLVQYFPHTKVFMQEGNIIFSSKGEFTADRIFVANGHLFKEWYPDLYTKSGTRLCRLQMMRTCKQPDSWRLGPNLCGSLTLLHYASFEEAPKIENHRIACKASWPFQMENGIHVLISQHEDGKLTIGDSHDYGDDVSPFDSEQIYDGIMEYTRYISQIPELRIESRWQGIYAKSGDGLPIVEQINKYTTFIGAMGGAGMTLSMGLADWVVSGELPEDFNLSSSRFEH